MERMIEGFTFTCKTELAVSDTLFTESFDAKDRHLGTIKFRFKNRMLKENMCVEDQKVFVKLRKLVGDESVELQEVEKDLVTDANVYAQQPAPEVFKPEVVKERWKQLSWSSYYDVTVTHYKNPESFLAITSNKALKEIENYEVRNPLSEPIIGAICGVNGEKIRRGKIMKITNDEVEVLLVDAGEIIQCKKTTLLELPRELITKVPFQTIHFRMLGIKPKFNMNVWPPKQRQAVHELMMSHVQPLKIFVVKNNEKSDELSKMEINSYDVFLIDRTSGSYLDDAAVESRIAERDVNVKKPNNEDSGNVSQENETEADVEILRQLLNKEFKDEVSDDEYFDEISQQDEESEKIETFESKAIEQSTSLTVSSLDFIHKQPHIEWRQNSAIIYLLVTAIDCEDYGLRVNDASLEITIKYKENRTEKAIINFFNLIDSKLCSHEIRGLNIIVRLPKKALDCEWPRLTETRERSQFIKFSAEKISMEIEEKRMESSLLKEKGSYAGLLPDCYEDECDSESFGSDAEDYS